MSVDTTPGVKTIKLNHSDRHHLIRLALEAEIAKREMELCRVKWRQATAASEAAGDAISAKMRVPTEAENVTIDLDEGAIHYRMPGIPPCEIGK